MVNIMDLYFSTYNKYVKIYGRDKLIHACQVGSFMEFYATDTEGPDLQKLSELLNIIVSRKDKSISTIDRTNPYMMGYPIVSHTKFLKLMVEGGYVVVVTEQVTPPPYPKRQVTGIYTSGTNLDDNEQKNNFLLGIYIEEISHKYVIGTALVDVSTGEVYIHETFTLEHMDEYYPLDEVVHICKNYNPKEIIICHNGITDFDKILDYFECKSNVYYCKSLADVNKLFGDIHKIKYQQELFLKVYPSSVTSSDTYLLFENLELEKVNYARIALSFVINYIYQNNKTTLVKLDVPTFLKNDKTIYLGNNALQQLSVFDNGGLYKIINHTQTPMGARFLKKQLTEPTYDADSLNYRYNLIQNIIDTDTLNILSTKLQFNDLEKLHRKLNLNIIHPMEFFIWYKNIIKGIELLEYLQLEPELLQHLNSIVKDIDNHFEIEQLKNFLLNDIHNRIFNADKHEDIEKLLSSINMCTDFMDDLAQYITSILPQGQNIVKLNKNDREGHYITLTTKRANILQNALKNQPFIELKDGIKISSTSLEFKIIGKGASTKIFTPEIRNNSNKLNDFIDEIKMLNKKYFLQFLNDVVISQNVYIHKLIKVISFWDFIYSGAKSSIKNNYIRPIIESKTKSFIQVENMRHPIIEKISNQIFVPMNVKLGLDEQDCILLYGLNSAGKSTLQKALGINIILAQIGYFVPCSSFVYNPYHSLLTRINSNDNLFKGLSSFTLEMAEIKAILKRSSENTLVIADEVCKGTEHDSSLVVVMSIIEILSKHKTSLITASHLHELAHSERLKQLNNVKLFHIHIDFDESTNTIVYNRELRPGSGENFYGLNIAKYLMNDPEFNSIANDIKSEFTKDCIIGNKWSKYNAKLNVNKCSVCNYYPVKSTDKPLEIHHINFQKNADKNGFIKDESFHKNHIANLVVLCDSCHDKIDTKELVIKGYIETNRGKILDYK
jgi:DNA mismatch repair protein MutS